MQIPAFLKIGDKIGIISTASKIDSDIINSAVNLLSSLGYFVELGENVFEKLNQFAGSDYQRTSDLQLMLDDSEIKAIICSRGGYGTLRTIEKINWNSFIAKPKWIVGFSDVTVLHSQLNQLRIASIHGVMPRYFFNDNIPSTSFNSLISVLTGNKIRYEIPPSPFNINGCANGELIGGNLSILYSLRGTPYDIDTRNKILFIEDLAEYLYHLDRMLMNLKLGGKLQQLSGLIVGSFTGLKDNETPFGKSIEEIILEHVSDFNFPVVFNFPSGHQNNNLTLKLGCIVKIEANTNKVLFTQ